MSKNVLVSGGTGFIGKNLIIGLIDKGYKVFAIVRNKKKIELEQNYMPSLKLVDVDQLFDMDYECPCFDVCYNLAAYGVNNKDRNLKEYINGNIMFSVQLMDFCYKNKTKKFIHTGSCSEYGYEDNQFYKTKETDAVKPANIYGATKASSVIILKTMAELYKMTMITLRPFGVFGEYEGAHRLIPQVISAILKKEPLAMTEGTQVRDYLYIRDLVNAYIIASEEELPLYEEYNVCSSNAISIRSLVDLFVKTNKLDSKYLNFGEIPIRKNEWMYYVGDNTKIKKYSSWKPMYSLEEGLKRTYDWYYNLLMRGER